MTIFMWNIGSSNSTLNIIKNIFYMKISRNAIISEGRPYYILHHIEDYILGWN